jgi:hypothetical protein
MGKANGSRECAPDDRLRVPTVSDDDSQRDGGHGAMRLCPPDDFLRRRGANARSTGPE